MLKKIMMATVLIIPTFFIGCNKVETAFDTDLEKIQVVTSIEPIREVTQIIGGDRIITKNIIKNGIDPHDYEPTSKDLITLNNSQIFLYNGLGLEEWVNKVVDSIKDMEVVVINTSENVDVIDENGNSIDNYNESMTKKKVDPHIWLSLTQCKVQSLNIKNALKSIDLENSNYYEDNYNEFVSKIDSLYTEYKEKFDSLKNKNFVTSHTAFGYLCKDFGLNQVSIEELFGEGEITPSMLKDLVNFCKENNVTTVFMPEVASKRLSETLANEANVKVVKIHSLESIPQNLTYLEAMRENLNIIYESLSR